MLSPKRIPPDITNRSKQKFSNHEHDLENP